MDYVISVLFLALLIKHRKNCYHIKKNKAARRTNYLVIVPSRSPRSTTTIDLKVQQVAQQGIFYFVDYEYVRLYYNPEQGDKEDLQQPVFYHLVLHVMSHLTNEQCSATLRGDRQIMGCEIFSWVRTIIIIANAISFLRVIGKQGPISPKDAHR